jgi:hypothetical protein
VSIMYQSAATSRPCAGVDEDILPAVRRTRARHARDYRLAGFSRCERVGYSTVCVAVQFSASRNGGCNYRSGNCTGYDIGDRASPAACRCFQKVAKNGAQPEPARPRLVRRFCAAPAVCGLRARARLRQRTTKFELVINLQESISRLPRGSVSIRRSRCSRSPTRCSNECARRTWCDPAGGSPAQVRSSVRLVASVAWPPATVVAKRTQRLHGVWD